MNVLLAVIVTVLFEFCAVFTMRREVLMIKEIGRAHV